MNSADKSLFARIGIGLVATTTILIACVLFAVNMSDGSQLPKGAFDLSGDWDFQNGPLVDGRPQFTDRVQVPEPLAPQLGSELKEEFWYRKKIQLSSRELNLSEPLAIFLGTIKGEHEIFWNGDRIGSGGKLVLGIYQLPGSLSKSGWAELRIRVKKTEHLFPGMVHKLPVAIGPTSSFDKVREYYMFDSGVKPLMLAVFKFCLFLLFSFLFISVPQKREYFSFAFFVLFSACAAALYSRYVPFYFDYFLRSALTFVATTFAFCSIPWVTADILRLSQRARSLARVYGATLGVTLLSATLWISSRSSEISLYQYAGRWLPIAVGIPSIVGCIWILNKLSPTLKHRQIQVGAFAILLFLGTVAWWLNSGTLFSFHYIPYPELWDIGLFAGLAVSAAMDMRFTTRRSERAGKVIPSWFSGFLASGIDQVTLELPMVAIAVDTVGYTRLLSEMDDEGKSQLHANIRARMAPVVERFGAQKLSDRGDGALFAWDLSGDERHRRSQVRMAVAGAEYLVMESANSVGIKFRVGVAAGIVRGELKGSELSFLGEPLNAASRLEAAARPGTVLLHDSVAGYLDPTTLSNEWIKIEVKGVAYRAMPLHKAS